MPSIRKIHKLDNSITISDYNSVLMYNGSITFSNKMYQLPLLIYIYNYLKHKLNKDLVNIIIIKYFNKLDNINKCNVNKHLNFYLSTRFNKKNTDDKYILCSINTNTNSVGKTYNKYNFKLLLNLQTYFYRDINNILSNINK